MSTLTNIVRIGLLGLATSSAFAAGSERASPVNSAIENSGIRINNSNNNCAAFTANLCMFDAVQTRCPELCNDVLRPQSTLVVQNTYHATSSTTTSPTSSSTTPSVTSSSTTPSPTSSSTTALPTSSSTTPSVTSSSTTTPPTSSSSSTIGLANTSSTAQLRTSSTSTPPPTSNAKAEATPPLDTDSKNQKKEYSSIASEPSKNNEVNDNSLFIAGATIGGLFTASILLLATLYNRNSLTRRSIKRDDKLQTIIIQGATATSQGDVEIDVGDIVAITHLEGDTSEYTRKRKRESENNSENDYNKKGKIEKDDHISNHTNLKRENIVDDTAQFTGGADSFWQKLVEYNTDRSISPDRK